MRSRAEGSAKVAAIVVVYHPDLELLRALLERLDSQVDGIFIIDNGPGEPGLEELAAAGSSHRHVRPGRNLGVAGGINLGIEQAREAGFDRVLFLDQDSLPAPGMVETLASAFDALRVNGEKPAAVGPVIRARETGKSAPFIRFRLPINRRLRGTSGSVPCDFIITSGMMTDLEALDAVGAMDATMFIDNIDLEWCFRARRAGYRVFGVYDAELDHSIGERRPLIRGSGIHYRHHTPERLYYMMRNRLLLYRGRAPFAWIAHDVVRLIGKLALFALIRPRRENQRAMWRGLIDGVRGRRNRPSAAGIG